MQLQLAILATSSFSAMSLFYRSLTQWDVTVDENNYMELQSSEGMSVGIYELESFLGNFDSSKLHDKVAAGSRSTEIYFSVRDRNEAVERAVSAGGTILSEPTAMSWGDVVQYIADPDGNICALAQAAG